MRHELEITTREEYDRPPTNKETLALKKEADKVFEKMFGKVKKRVGSVDKRSLDFFRTAFNYEQNSVIESIEFLIGDSSRIKYERGLGLSKITQELGINDELNKPLRKSLVFDLKNTVGDIKVYLEDSRRGITGHYRPITSFLVEVRNQIESLKTPEELWD